MHSGIQGARQPVEIARAAPAKREAHAGPLEVGRGFERCPNIGEREALGGKEAHRVKPGFNLETIAGRAREVGSQQARAGGRDRPVDRREQRALTTTCIGTVNLKTGASGWIDQQAAARFCPARHGEACRAAGLSELYVVKQQTCCCEFRLGEGAEAFECGDAKSFLQEGLAGLGRTGPGGAFGDGRRHHLPQAREGGTFPVGVGDQQFAEGPGEQRVTDPGGLQRHQLKQAGGHVAHGQRRLALPGERKGGQSLALPGRQEGIFCQGAGRDNAHDFAADDGFRAALAGIGRAFGLLAHRDPAASLDQAGEVAVGRVIGDARHRDRRAVMFAAGGQCDVQNPGSDDGIVKEQLVEIAHPEKQERVRLGCLDG